MLPQLPATPQPGSHSTALKYPPYRQNATRLQLKLLRHYLCHEPLQLPQQPLDESREGLKQLKKYNTIDQINANKYQHRTACMDQPRPVVTSMKKLSELISESSLPLIKSYVKKGKLGVAQKLIIHKIR